VQRRVGERGSGSTERDAGQEAAAERKWDTHRRADIPNQADACVVKLAAIELSAQRQSPDG
jgi:hypothetical protein